jgi:hypothetical protein
MIFKILFTTDRRFVLCSLPDRYVSVPSMMIFAKIAREEGGAI